MISNLIPDKHDAVAGSKTSCFSHPFSPVSRFSSYSVHSCYFLSLSHLPSSLPRSLSLPLFLVFLISSPSSSSFILLFVFLYIHLTLPLPLLLVFLSTSLISSYLLLLSRFSLFPFCFFYLSLILHFSSFPSSSSCFYFHFFPASFLSFPTPLPIFLRVSLFSFLFPFSSFLIF